MTQTLRYPDAATLCDPRAGGSGLRDHDADSSAAIASINSSTLTGLGR